MAKPEWLIELEDELKISNTRSLVLVTAASAQHQLTELLASHLLAKLESSDELFHDGKPLSSFSAQIAVAYRMEIISKQLRKVLTALRRMRNECAHTSGTVELSQSPFSNFLNTMCEILYLTTQNRPRPRDKLVSIAVEVVSGLASATQGKQAKENEIEKPHHSFSRIEGGQIYSFSDLVGARPPFFDRDGLSAPTDLPKL